MKPFLLLLSIVALLSTAVFAQETETETENEPFPKPWVFGVNLGGAYQSSDVCVDRAGLGWGLTLGRHYYPKGNFPLWFGIRGRFLNAQTYGADKKIRGNNANNPIIQGLGYQGDSVYHNHKTVFNKLSMELMIGANQLYKKHGVLLYLFGGGGLDFYRARHDHLDVFDAPYDYQSVYNNVEAIGGPVGEELDFIRDGDYETYAQGNPDAQTQFTPYVGFGLGYQVSGRFAIGIEHKTTFALADNIDGQLWNLNNARSGNDYWHYTGLKMQFGLVPRSLMDGSQTPPPFEEPVGPSGTLLPPEIKITNPVEDPYYSESINVYITANISHVSQKDNVIFTVNGMAFRAFTFDPGSGNFSASVNVEAGENELVISAFNEAGKDLETQTIIVEEDQEPTLQPPLVDISFPASSPFTTNSPNLDLTASILNVDTRDGVSFLANGSASNDFSFNAANQQFSANVSLQPGENIFTVKGSNTAGTDEESVTIIYEEPTTSSPPPVVTITQPSNDPHSTQNSVAPVSATVDNVSQRSQVTATLNGSSFSAFSFVPATGLFEASLPLNPGSNTLVISAVNNAGSDQGSTTIIYEEPAPTIQPPTVNITQPSSDPFNTNSSVANISANITNVDNQSQVSASLNGSPFTAFSFVPATGQFTAMLNLNQGANTLVISASNEAGSDQGSITIIYTKPTPPPVVTFTSPGNNPFTSLTPAANVSANITNVDSRSQVSATFNGTPYSAFSFTPGTGRFDAALSLNQGTNTLVINATNSAGSDSESQTIVFQNVSPPPPTGKPPVITVVTPTSNPATLNTAAAAINATITNITSASQISVTANGANTNAFNFNSATGYFNMNVNLQQGSNNFVISASNMYGSDQKSVTINYVVPVQPPTVTITQPNSSGQSFTSASQTVTAIVSNVDTRSGIQVQVNGVSVSNFSYQPSTGNLSIPVSLANGSNSVSITASNSAGSDTKSTSLILNLPKKPPVVDIRTPNTDPFISAQPSVNVTASVQEVSNRNDISVKVNGNTLSSFSFNPSTEMVSFTANLNVGSNVIVVSASNADGSDSDQTTIQHNPPMDPPLVTITKPNYSGQKFTAPNQSIEAVIQNVSSASQVSVKFNGATISAFNFNPAMGSVTFPVNLQNGNNNVTISATNGGGSHSASTSLIYEKPAPVPTIPAPTVSITNPGSNPFNTNQGNINISSIVKYVDEARDVNVSLNGQRINNFQFNGMTGDVMVNVDLQPGSNSFQITGTNEMGSDSKSLTINFTPPVEPPVVQITSPAGSSVNVSSQPISVQATVSNIDNRNQITVTVNGSGLSSFNFNASTGLVSFQAGLNEGANMVKVSASNSAGSDSDESEISYSIPKPPVVNIQSPVNGANLSSASTPVQATVTNVSASNQITVQVNGNRVNNFSFNPGNGSLSFTANLKEGGNQIVVSASNSFGSDSKNVSVNYTKPQPPIVNITNPSGPEKTVSSMEYQVQVSVQNVPVVNDLSVTVNGANYSNFNYDPNTGKATIFMDLDPGVTTIVVTGVNEFGSDSDQCRLIRQALPPSIQVSSPSNNSTVNQSSIQVQGTVTNLTSASQLSGGVNSQTISNFNFNPSNGQFSFTANLRAGSNSINVSANNDGGNDSKSFNVTYAPPVPPSISLINPPSKNEMTPNPSMFVEMQLTGVNQPNQVSVTVNGSPVNNFMFEPSSGMISVEVMLNQGPNTVTVTATNSFGSSSEQLTITRQ